MSLPFIDTKKIESDISSIQDDFSNIKYELNSISQGLRNDFVGIGTENCADYLDEIYQKVCAMSGKFNALNEPYKNVIHVINELNDG